jgi:hypothetical protein
MLRALNGLVDIGRYRPSITDQGQPANVVPNTMTGAIYYIRAHQRRCHSPGQTEQQCVVQSHLKKNKFGFDQVVPLSLGLSLMDEPFV